MLNALALAATYPLYEYLRNQESHNNKTESYSSYVVPVLWTFVVVALQLLQKRGSSAMKAGAGSGSAANSPVPATAPAPPSSTSKQQRSLTASSTINTTSGPPPFPDPLTSSNKSLAKTKLSKTATTGAPGGGPANKASLAPLKLAPEATTFNPAHRGPQTAHPRLSTAQQHDQDSFLQKPRSFSSHRPQSRGIHFSIDTVPRQTVFKAIVSSRPRLESQTDGTSQVEFAASVVKGMDSPSGEEALDALAAEQQNPKSANPLSSPCFFHSQFDDAVNIQKVLEEISHDEYLSHSRLVQTAAGVREVARQLARRTVRAHAKNVMIVTKARDNNLVMLTRELAHWLIKTPRYGNPTGVNVYVDLKLKNSKRFDAAGMLEEDPCFAEQLKFWTPDLCWTSPEKFDLVLTLGGDGTVLFTSWLFQRIVPPILSFSLGSLGFLTNFQFESYKEHLNKVLDVGMRVNLKMRFTCTVYREVDGEQKEAEQFEVLNELVIDRGPSPYVSQLELYGDDDLITVVQADGCIFSTPTGSTAYSLSAGGSLVHPDIPAILLTPICPHTLSFRPMIFNDSMQLRVCVPKDSRATAWCAFDGKGRLELRQGDMVTIAASQYPFPTVLSTPTEWIDAVSRTLRWNSRAAAQKGWDGDSAVGGDDREPGEPEFDIDTDSGAYSEEGASPTISPGGIVKRNMALFSS